MNSKMKRKMAAKLIKSCAAFEMVVDSATWDNNNFGEYVVDIDDVAFDLLGVPDDFRSEFTDDLQKAALISDEALDRKITYVLKCMRLEKKENPKLFTKKNLEQI